MSPDLSTKTCSTLPLCIAKNHVRVGRHTTVSFNRTLRIPEDGNTYPLPAGFGSLPIYRVSDYATKVPIKWLENGGFFIPLYQREALYLEFHGAEWRPTIAKVAVGMINAITGKKFDATLRDQSQDYVVIPNQQWLDGINAEKGVVGQFVAMPLGKGYTIEEQVTDEAKHGGFQLMFFEPKAERFPTDDPAITLRQHKTFASRHGGFLPEIKRIAAPKQPLPQNLSEMEKKSSSGRWETFQDSDTMEPMILEEGTTSAASPALFASPRSASRNVDVPLGSAPRVTSPRKKAEVNLEMGIAAGGSIQQQIITDPYGATTWDAASATPVYIYIVNSTAFEFITGEKPPATPITAHSYKKRGIPWYSNYSENTPSLAASKILKSIKSVFQIDKGRRSSATQYEHDGKLHHRQQYHIKRSLEIIRRIHVPSVEERMDSLLVFAHHAFNRQEYESTIHAATSILDLMPDSIEALLLRARAYSFIGNHHLADMDSTFILQSDPQNVEALLVRAHANYATGWIPQATEDALAAIRLAPANTYARQLFHAISQQS